MNNPVFLALLTLGGLYVAKLWRDDLRAAQAGKPHANALPGAAPASVRAVVIGITGAVLLLLAETWGEFALGLAAQQSRITWLFALCSVTSAPIMEELIFRGWLVIENRGAVVMWLGAVAASVIFAALHPFLWKWDDSGFAFTVNSKSWFSTAAIFVNSLWFYAARLGRWNPTRSLLPCFAAHAAKNIGVVAIKATLGFVGGAW